MVRGKEQVLADGTLNQIQLALEQERNQAVVRKENVAAFKERKKAFARIATYSRELLNCLYPYSQERTLEMAQMLGNMEKELGEIEQEQLQRMK